MSKVSDHFRGTNLGWLISVLWEKVTSTATPGRDAPLSRATPPTTSAPTRCRRSRTAQLGRVTSVRSTRSSSSPRIGEMSKIPQGTHCGVAILVSGEASAGKQCCARSPPLPRGRYYEAVQVYWQSLSLFQRIHLQG